MSIIKGRNVYLKNDDTNIERALRKLKKLVASSGVLMDLKEKEYYIKPNIRKKLKRSAAKKRWQRLLDSQKLPTKLY